MTFTTRTMGWSRSWPVAAPRIPASARDSSPPNAERFRCHSRRTWFWAASPITTARYARAGRRCRSGSTIDLPEGGLFAIDPTDERVMFSHPQGAAFKRSRDGGTTWTTIGGTIDVGVGRQMRSRFMAIRPDDSSKLWLSAMYGRLHFSLDGGTTWDFVKDAAGAPFLVDGFDTADDGPFTFAFAPTDTKVLYVGTRRGYLWRTSNAAVASAGWQQLNTPYAGGTAGGFLIAASAVHPTDPTTVYIGYFDRSAPRFLPSGAERSSPMAA